MHVTLTVSTVEASSEKTTTVHSRPAVNRSHWRPDPDPDPGPGRGWEGRAPAGRRCGSEGTAACVGRWRRTSGVAGRWRQTVVASCCGPDCWTCSPAAGTRWATAGLKREGSSSSRFLFFCCFICRATSKAVPALTFCRWLSTFI